MPPDVPPLAEQEAEGQFRETVQRIVDGVIEDVRSGHVTDREKARSNAELTSYRSRYGTHFASAVEAIKYADRDDTDEVQSKIREIGGRLVWAAVRRELKRRAEYKALKE